MAGTKRPADDFNLNLSFLDSILTGYDYDYGDYNYGDWNYALTGYDVPVIPSPPQLIRRYRSRYNNIYQQPISNLPFLSYSTAEAPAPPAPPFNIYKALLRHPHLFFQFALRLPMQTFLDLYAIDKEFHYRLNRYNNSVMHDYAAYHAPDAANIFSFPLYPHLCISDPVLKPMDGRTHLARDTPGMQWVRMVVGRDKIVRDILTALAMDGHMLPKRAKTVLMKFWVLMETRRIALREGYVADRAIWSDDDIKVFHLFLFKLDMRFSHPIQGQGQCLLSHILLTQRSLLTLHHVLLGTLNPPLDYVELTDMIIRTYLTEELDTDAYPWLEDEVETTMTVEEWGVLRRENWDMFGKIMESGVDMLLREGVRRGLNIQQWVLDFVLYGYVNLNGSGRNLPIPRLWREQQRPVVPDEGWMGECEMEGLVEELDGRFKVDKSKPWAGGKGGVRLGQEELEEMLLERLRLNEPLPTH
jgi:hypothetical protein